MQAPVRDLYKRKTNGPNQIARRRGLDSRSVGGINREHYETRLFVGAGAGFLFIIRV